MEERVKIGAEGTLVIPAMYCRALGVQSGDEVIVELEHGEVRVHRMDSALERFRKKAESLPPPESGSYTDDFLQFRKQDSGA